MIRQAQSSPLQPASSRRQDQGYEYMFVAAGPGRGTMQQIPWPSSRPEEFHNSDLFFYGFLYDMASAAERALLRRGNRAPVAANNDAILGLQEVTGRSREGEECAVCLQGFRADETLRAMPCCHVFHHNCISQWLNRSASCPLCRHQLPEEQRSTRI